MIAMQDTGIENDCIVKQPSLPTAGMAGEGSVPAATSVLIWSTPGTDLANGIASHASVRLVAEKPDLESYSILVVLDNDPADLLDRIYTLEGELIRRFTKNQFDLRVTVAPSPQHDEALLEGKILCYKRIPR